MINGKLIYPFDDYNIIRLIGYGRYINVFMDNKYSYRFVLNGSTIDSKYNGIVSYILLLKEKIMKVIEQQNNFDFNILNEIINAFIYEINDAIDLFVCNNKIPLSTDMIEYFDFDKNNIILYPYLNNVIRLVMNIRGYNVTENGDIEKCVIQNHSLLIDEFISMPHDAFENKTSFSDGILFSSFTSEKVDVDILTKLNNKIRRSDYFYGDSNVKKLIKNDHVLKLRKY